MPGTEVIAQSIEHIVEESMNKSSFRCTLNTIRARLVEQRCLTEELVDNCIKLSLQWAVSEATLVRECDVYREEDGNWLVVLHMHIPRELRPEYAYWVREPVYNSLASLPASSDFWVYKYPHLKETWKRKFIYLTKCAESQEISRRFRAKVHGVVMGWILHSQSWRQLMVLIKEEGDGVVGWMDKAETVPREEKMGVYGRGPLDYGRSPLWFYVLSVKKVEPDYGCLPSGYGWKINLSRASKNFPAALIRRYAPWIKAKGVKRIIGRKSWVRCNKHPGPEVLKKVSRELMGEVIEVV